MTDDSVTGFRVTDEWPEDGRKRGVRHDYDAIAKHLLSGDIVVVAFPIERAEKVRRLWSKAMEYRGLRINTRMVGDQLYIRAKQ